MQLIEILDWLRELAPEKSALDNDPIGLLISPTSTDVSSVVVCLDAYMPVVEYAISQSTGLIVCHHPLIYQPLRRLESEEPIAKSVMALVRAGIGLYAMHTNWDQASNGVNDTLSKVLGLTDVVALAETGVAGIARIGSLSSPLSIEELAVHIEKAIDCRRTSTLRYFPSKSRRHIRRVAVCGGAGGSIVADAVASGADALITSDVRHHEFLEAYERDITLYDAGHAGTEEPGMRSLANMLSVNFPALSVLYAAF